MPYPAGTYINQILDPAVRAEFEQMYSLFQGYLSREHKDSGTHGNVTADSLNLIANTQTSATGNLTADGSAAIDGTVTADADGDPVIIGSLGSGIGQGISLRNGSTAFAAFWEMVAIQAATKRTLRFIDALESGSAYAFQFQQNSGGTGTYNYILMPGSSVGLSLGTDSAGSRMDEVCANTFTGGEKGVWTPALKFGGASTGLTYSTQSGTYSRFMNVVVAEMRIVLTSKGSSTGSATITGLPYTAAGFPSALIDFGGGGASLSSTPYATVSGTTLFPLHIVAGVRTQLADTNFTGTDDLRIGLTYRV